jgi:4-hydroxybenzoate polyprenyltransferase
MFGARVVMASAALTIVEIVHDDLYLGGRPILRNLCNVGGYCTFELGATLVLSPTRTLDKTAVIALVCSTLIIFTTIQAQDFADVEGDKISGRRTIPIIAPEGSRISILAALMLWSWVLAALWGLGPVSGAIFFIMGCFVGARYFKFRDAKADKLSYLLYNVWLVAAHVLPANARVQALFW